MSKVQSNPSSVLIQNRTVAQLAFTCSKSTIQTPEYCVKSVQR